MARFWIPAFSHPIFLSKFCFQNLQVIVGYFYFEDFGVNLACLEPNTPA
jgi:hypothetical protein